MSAALTLLVLALQAPLLQGPLTNASALAPRTPLDSSYTCTSSPLAARFR